MIKDQSPKERLHSLLKKTALYLSIGIAYLVFTKITSLGIPCIFHLITGLHCPGCGISRMFISLAALDFKGAFDANALLFCLLPLAIALFIYKAAIYVKNGYIKDEPWLKASYIILFVLCVLFTVMRNTETFSYLAPH